MSNIDIFVTTTGNTVHIVAGPHDGQHATVVSAHGFDVKVALRNGDIVTVDISDLNA